MQAFILNKALHYYYCKHLLLYKQRVLKKFAYTNFHYLLSTLALTHITKKHISQNNRGNDAYKIGK